MSTERNVMVGLLLPANRRKRRYDEEMTMERYRLDRSKIMEAKRTQSLGKLLSNQGQACFDDDYAIKVTMADVGILAGVPSGTWHHYVYHGVRAKGAVCERVAAVLGVQTDSILQDSCALLYLRSERQRLSDVDRKR